MLFENVGTIQNHAAAGMNPAAARLFLMVVS